MEKDTNSQEKNYQIIDGVVITPEILKTIGYIQEDSNDALETLKAESMTLVYAFMTASSDESLDDTERLSHVRTICNLVEFMDSLKIPRGVFVSEQEGGEK